MDPKYACYGHIYILCYYDSELETSWILMKSK